MVQEEDLQPLSEPIVAPIKVRSFAVQEKGLPTTRFDRKWVFGLEEGPLTCLK